MKFSNVHFQPVFSNMVLVLVCLMETPFSYPEFFFILTPILKLFILFLSIPLEFLNKRLKYRVFKETLRKGKSGI